MLPSKSTEEILEKIKIVYNSLKKPGSWYTGLAIKTLIQRQFFSLIESFNNKSILSGRWSTYAHFNKQLAFQNLLDKQNIKANSTVLIHPLLPIVFVDILLDRKVNIISLDIDKSTLNWNKNTLISYIRQLRSINKDPDLIIQYSFNGLVDEITESIQEIQSFTIPNFIFIDQPELNIQTIKLWDKLELGSVLWSAGNSFCIDELANTIDQQLPEKNWYFSWYLEVRTKSILEYHLSQSNDYFNPILQAYFYILLNLYKEKVWWAFSLPYLSRFVNTIQFNNLNEAKNVILENYTNLDYIALPDVIFEIENAINSKIQPNKNIIEKNHKASNLAKLLYHQLVDLLPKLQPESLEITNFFLDKSYTVYFFYTTNFDYWDNFCQTHNYSKANGLEIHPKLKNKPNLNTANFVANYYFGIQV